MKSSTLHISKLSIYPVKSLAGIDLNEAKLITTGLEYDRQWMIIDDNGRFISQRQHPEMALIQPSLKQGSLTLSQANKKDCQVTDANSDSQRINVQVWNTTIEAIHVDSEADAWLSDSLARSCRLVRFSNNTVRSLDINYALPSDQTAFADGFPLLLLSEASLNWLNQQLQQPVPMTRFRPNIVVSGCEPFAEDNWKQIHIADISMRVVKPCPRCVITTIDPNTGCKMGPEPLKTLFKFRKQGKQAMFGQNLIHDACGKLEIGDSVKITRLNLSHKT